MMYIASVRNKKTRELTIITRDYETKKEFEEDLRGNGYSIRFITTEDKFDEDCEKWHQRNERSKDYHNVEYAVYKDDAKRMGMTIPQYKAWLKAE